MDPVIVLVNAITKKPWEKVTIIQILKTRALEIVPVGVMIVVELCLWR